MSPHLAIILLSYNRPDVTTRCIDSLGACTSGDFDIVVVDNSSDEKPAQHLKTLHPRIHVLRPGYNAGFCGGNNIGIDYALKNGYQHLLLLNDDTLVSPNFLGPLVMEARMRKESEYVLIGKIYCNHDRNIVWYAGGHLSILQGIGKHHGHFRPDRSSYDIPSRVDYVTGCMLFAPAATFLKVGKLNEHLFAYLDDTDYSFRLKKAGIPCYYVPGSKI